MNQPDRIAAERAAKWEASTWDTARRAVLVHGIGPWLHHTLAGTAVYAALPQTFRAWLSEIFRLNTQRIARFHDDLGRVLDAAARAGIEVLPLKGSVLTTLYYFPAALRPMSDLDLLVRPEDRRSMAKVLEALGYRYLPPARGANPIDGFEHPSAVRVVSRDFEHPDNPRAVDLHTGLSKRYFRTSASTDISSALWSESAPGSLLGHPARSVPAPALLMQLAHNATFDHWGGEARIIQWLDLAAVAAHAASPSDAPCSNHVYPALKIASRGLPERFKALDLVRLESRIAPSLREWCQSVSLDGRCGLAGESEYSSRLRALWRRWKPSPWRISIAYPAMPMLTGYLHYVRELVARSFFGHTQRAHVGLG